MGMVETGQSDKETESISVHVELTKLVGLTASLGEAVDKLEEEISPVLIPMDRESPGVFLPVQTEPISPLLVELMQQGDRLMGIIEHINKLIERVQL